MNKYSIGQSSTSGNFIVSDEDYFTIFECQSLSEAEQFIEDISGIESDIYDLYVENAA